MYTCTCTAALSLSLSLAIFAVDDDRMVDRHAMEKGFAVWQVSHLPDRFVI